jgi:hypothetical protein
MDTDDGKYNSLILEVTKVSSSIRGLFINEVAILETTIDIFLATHFCLSDQTVEDFLKWIMPSKVITLENKRILFKKVVENHYPKLKEKNPDFHARLGEIIECRNKLAHHQLDVTDEGLDKYEKGKKFFLINNVKESEVVIIADILAKAEKVKNYAIEISKFIRE